MTLVETGPPAARKELGCGPWDGGRQQHICLSCTLGWQQPPGLQLCLLLIPSHVFKLDLLLMLNERLQIPCAGRSSRHKPLQIELMLATTPIGSL